MEALSPVLAGSGFDGGSFQAPQQMLVGVWRRPNKKHPFGQGYTAPTKVSSRPHTGVDDTDHAETMMHMGTRPGCCLLLTAAKRFPLHHTVSDTTSYR
jgi:hypothetical protein